VGAGFRSLVEADRFRLSARATFRLVTTTTSVAIRVPGPLRPYCDGARELRLDAPTVRAALETLERDHPALHRNICDETGAVRRHVNIFVNTGNIRDGNGLDTALAPGDVVTVLPAVSGG
jgi:MoaD family protein